MVGTGVAGFGGDGGPATAATLAFPAGVVVDADGNLFIADFWNQRIRRVDAVTGVIATVAGTGVAEFAGYGGPATSAGLSSPVGVAVDAQGNLFIADSRNHSVHRVELENSRPSANAGPDQPSVEATSASGAPVTLDGSMSNDPDSDPLTFTWDGPFGSLSGPVVSPILPLGAHLFTLTVDDGKFGTATDTVTVMVQDTTAPTLTLSTTSVEVLATTGTGAVVDVLVDSGAMATDAVDPSPVITHDGPVAPAEFPIETTTLVTITATDASGNAASQVFTVTVQTATQGLEDLDAQLQTIIDNNPGAPFAQDLAAAQAKLQKALNKLAKTPPQRQKAVGQLKKAIQALQDAVSNGLDPAVGVSLMDEVAANGRLIAVEAIEDAIAQGGNPAKISAAQQHLADGDQLRWAGDFEGALGEYKKAAKKAEQA